jgi:MFS family permease
VKTLRASIVLASVARIASAFSIPQPGEPLPGSSPALTGAPRSDRTAAHAATPVRPLRRSLNAAVAEGASAEVFAACASGAVIIGWALYLGASAAVIGLLGALPLGAQVVSLPAAWFTSARSRKAVTLWAVGISRLTFLPLLALPTLAVDASTKLHLFMTIVAVSTIFSVVGNSAWVAWMGDLVPDRIRGRFVGRRTIYISIAGTLTSLGAAVLLDRLSPDRLDRRRPLHAHRHRLPGRGGERGADAASARAPRSRRARRVRLAGAPARARRPSGPARSSAISSPGTQAIGISASFFAYHMLTNLHTGFLVVAAHGVGVAALRIASARLWGYAVDRIGAGPVLVFCSFGIAASPLTWFFITPDRLWLIAFDAVFAGFLWAGHGIAAFDLSIGLAPRVSRPFYLGAFATAGGLGFGVASILAGHLATLIPAHFELAGEAWTNLHVLFLISAAGRLASAALSLRLHDPGAQGDVRQLIRALTERTGLTAFAPSPVWWEGRVRAWVVGRPPR